MKSKIIFSLLAALPLVIGGCATNAHYVETGGRENVVSVNQINIQDYIQAANAATSELLASGALDRVATPPAVLAISRIVNNTGQQIDTDLLTKKIRVAVLNSGKALTTTTMGLGGTAEDPRLMFRHAETGLHPMGEDHGNSRAGWQHPPVHLQLPAFTDRRQDRSGRLGR